MVFHEVDDYPMSIINAIAKQELNDSQSKNRRAETNTASNKIQLILPYTGKKGKKLITKMKKRITKTLPENVQAIVTYQSKKLSTKFNAKDKTESYHQSNFVYYGNCLNQTCSEDYIGETDLRIKERIIDHNKRDKNSNILKHPREEGHCHVWDTDFKGLGNNYRSAFKRKISKAYFYLIMLTGLSAKYCRYF